jgi:hypothetical protein
MAKKIVFVSFSQEIYWQNGGYRKWPLWGPSLRPNDQVNIFYPEFPRKNIIHRKLRARK